MNKKMLLAGLSVLSFVSTAFAASERIANWSDRDYGISQWKVIALTKASLATALFVEDEGDTCEVTEVSQFENVSAQRGLKRRRDVFVISTYVERSGSYCPRGSSATCDTYFTKDSQGRWQVSHSDCESGPGLDD